MSDSNLQRPRRDPNTAGRLSREDAVALLVRGGELLAQGEYQSAADHYIRVVGFDDATITAAALMGLAEARYRSNDEKAAVATWQAVVDLGETPSTYRAWRNLAAARVRDNDLVGALDAYREADRRAPAEDKPEIANRLGWLSKETGNVGASKKYFAQGRGDRPFLSATVLIIAVTSVISLSALYASDSTLFELLQLDKPAVAAGEYWRLWTVTLLHGDLLHLGFNMYALYLAGMIVERWYGSIRFVVFYLTCAAAGSTASFVFGGGDFSVGASGAVFGLFGVLLTAGRIHHPVDRDSRNLVPQLAMIIVINIAFGFASGGQIDNAAHIGGLVAGMWLGALVPPTGVPTMSSLWHRPGEARAAVGRATPPGYVMAAGVGAVGVVVVAGVIFGTTARTAVADPAVARAQDRLRLGDRFLGRRLAAHRDHHLGQRVRDGTLRREVAAALAERRHQARPSHPVAHGSADLREPQVDAVALQIGEQPSQHVGGRDIEIGGRRDVDHDRARRRRLCLEQRDDLVLRDVRVDERQRNVGPEDQDLGDRDGVRVAFGVGVDRRVTRDAGQHRDVRTARLVQDRHERQGDRDAHPGQRRREDHAAEGSHREQEIGPLPGQVPAQFADIHEARRPT